MKNFEVGQRVKIIVHNTMFIGIECCMEKLLRGRVKEVYPDQVVVFVTEAEFYANGLREDVIPDGGLTFGQWNSDYEVFEISNSEETKEEKTMDNEKYKIRYVMSQEEVAKSVSDLCQKEGYEEITVEDVISDLNGSGLEFTNDEKYFMEQKSWERFIKELSEIKMARCGLKRVKDLNEFPLKSREIAYIIILETESMGINFRQSDVSFAVSNSRIESEDTIHTKEEWRGIIVDYISDTILAAMLV